MRSGTGDVKNVLNQNKIKFCEKIMNDHFKIRRHTKAEEYLA